MTRAGGTTGASAVRGTGRGEKDACYVVRCKSLNLRKAGGCLPGAPAARAGQPVWDLVQTPYELSSLRSKCWLTTCVDHTT